MSVDTRKYHTPILLYFIISRIISLCITHAEEVLCKHNTYMRILDMILSHTHDSTFKAVIRNCIYYFIKKFLKR